MKKKFCQNCIFDQSTVDYLIANYNLEPSIAQLLSSRGVTIENSEKYFNFNRSNFYDSLLMLNMDKAVEIVTNAMKHNGKILVYGDYDADGLTASSILKLFFENNGVYCDVLIPTREEGYGMHLDNVISAFDKTNYDLVITVDCGISNKDEIDYLQNRYPDTVFLVTDHHEVPLVLPNCVCVNPKLGYPFPLLSGSGVAFKLVQALAGLDVATRYADLASVGTIADMMPLIDENRDLVRLGLANFNHVGLLKLASMSKATLPINATDVAMKLSPKINAAGRLGKPELALQVMLMQDSANTKTIAELILLNEERKNVLDEMLLSADKQILEQNCVEKNVIFVSGDDWQRGILGIAANRYREKYNLPAVCMVKDGDNYVGSARSIDTLDLFSLFSKVSDCLVKFGGHRASVGFSVSCENLTQLEDRLSSELAKVDKSLFDPITYYDFDYCDEFINATYTSQLDLLQPILPNSKPVYYAKSFVKQVALFGAERNHLKLILDNGLELKGFFKYAEMYDALNTNCECEALFTLEFDSYAKKVVGILTQLQINNSLHFDELYARNLFSRFSDKFDSERQLTDSQIKQELKKSNTLAIFNSYAEFEQASKVFDFTDYYLNIFRLDSYYNNAVLISPTNTDMFSNYKNIIAFNRYDGFTPLFSRNTKYRKKVSERPSFLNVELSREICMSVYKALKGSGRAFDLRSCFDKAMLFELSYNQFELAIRVFDELKLLEYCPCPYSLVLLPSKKVNLCDSKLFSFFSKSS